MGRKCGYLAAVGGILGGAEMILIPEVPFELEEVAQVVLDAYVQGKNHALIVVAEGARPDINRIAEYLRQHQVGFDVRVTILGHVQRGGRASAFDRLLATRLGVAAVKELLKGNLGTMIGLKGAMTGTVPLEEATSHQRKVRDEYIELFNLVS